VSFALEELIQLDHLLENLAVVKNGDVYLNYQPVSEVEYFSFLQLLVVAV
jgi:hypothetical protein